MMDLRINSTVYVKVLSSEPMESLLSVSPSKEIKWAKKKWLSYEDRREQVMDDYSGNCNNVNGNSDGRQRDRGAQ